MATNFRRGDDPYAPGDAVAEARAFLDAGVDGLFTDHAGTAVEARGRWRAAARSRAEPGSAEGTGEVLDDLGAGQLGQQPARHQQLGAPDAGADDRDVDVEAPGRRRAAATTPAARAA